MPVPILQLTDLHLFAGPSIRLKGIPTHATLDAVLRFIDRGSQSFEHLIITGDLAHDGSLEAYTALRDRLGDRVTGCHLLPGNHDDRAHIKRVFPELFAAEDTFLTFSFETHGWRLIGLDSLCPGEVSGRMSGKQLEWLKLELSAHALQPTILFIHHPPFSLQSAWLDKIGLESADEFMSIVQASPQVRVLSAGHVHQVFEAQWGTTALLTTPATSVQFRPRQATPVYESVAPGYRVFFLEQDSYQTECVRLPENEYEPFNDTES